MYLSLISLFSLFSSNAFADDFNFLEDAPEAAADSMDPVEYWPHKIVLDSQTKSLLLVWFDTQKPRTQKIGFASVEKLFVLPGQQGFPTELHLQLTDKRRFMAAMKFGNLQQPSLLMSALIGVSVQKDEKP